MSNERCLERCGQDPEELRVIQGPQENQLIYKVGQGRAGLKEQAFQGEGVGGEAWWAAGEDEGMWVWANRGDNRPTGTTVYIRRLLEPWLVVPLWSVTQSKLGSPGRLC